MKKILLILAILVVLGGGIGAYFFLKPSETDLLFEKCKDKVLSQLKAPATAVFGEYQHTERYQEEFKYSEGKIDQEVFTFSLDAQNSYSAMIRSTWKCEINYEEDKIAWVHIERI